MYVCYTNILSAYLLLHIYMNVDICISAHRYKYTHASVHDEKEARRKEGRREEKGKEIDIIVLGKIYSFLEISFHIFRAFILLRIISFT